MWPAKGPSWAVWLCVLVCTCSVTGVLGSGILHLLPFNFQDGRARSQVGVGKHHRNLE